MDLQKDITGVITVAVVIQEKTLKAVLVIGEEDDRCFLRPCHGCGHTDDAKNRVQR